MIILIGYMGSGKTFIGGVFSLILKKKFYDLDEIIFNWKNQYIHNMLFKYNENFFRNIEKYVLFFLASKNKNIIFSQGGGTICFNNNILYISKLGLTYYLSLLSKEILNRIKNQKYNRPLISFLCGDKLLFFVHKNISNRNKFYDKSIYKINLENSFSQDTVFLTYNKSSIISYQNGFIYTIK